MAEIETCIAHVTHDQTEAMTMGTRICIMNEGEIQQIAPPKTIYHHPVNMFVAGFIGSPSMNFLNGEMISERDGKQLLNAAQIKPDKYILGVRPEDRLQLYHPYQRSVSQPVVRLQAGCQYQIIYHFISTLFRMYKKMIRVSRIKFMEGIICA